MNAASELQELLPGLVRSGLPEVEVYLKEGRSRRFEIGAQGRITLQSREVAWAVRAGGRRASFFAAGSGRPGRSGAWPSADGGPLYLPSPAAVAAWTRPADLDAPLLAESEAIALLETIDRHLRSEVPGARLIRGYVEEGTSEASLANSRGVEAHVHRRSAALFLEAARPSAAGSRASAYLAARAARSFSPSALARRLIDRLLLAEAGEAVERDRGEVVLAPAVVAAILARLRPLFVGPPAETAARRLRDRSGRLGSRHLTVIDDGRHPGGPLAAPVDGEGVETRRVVLVEEGVFRQPLLSWREAKPGQRWSGCAARDSWRDVPEPAPTHLYVRPDPGVPAPSLIASVARGFYLLESPGGGRFDLEADRFRLPVRGFVLRKGRSVAAFSHATLGGAISSLLRGVQAVARDLTLFPGRGLLGGPTIVVSGLELRGEPVRRPPADRSVPPPAASDPGRRLENDGGS